MPSERLSQGTLKNSTVSMNVINRTLDDRYDPLTQRILNDEGGTYYSRRDKMKLEYAPATAISGKGSSL